jgi:hypothetical protein
MLHKVKAREAEAPAVREPTVDEFQQLLRAFEDGAEIVRFFGRCFTRRWYEAFEAEVERGLRQGAIDMCRRHLAEIQRHPDYDRQTYYKQQEARITQELADLEAGKPMLWELEKNKRIEERRARRRAAVGLADA